MEERIKIEFNIKREISFSNTIDVGSRTDKKFIICPPEAFVFTAAATDILTSGLHGFLNGFAGQVTTDDTLPGGLLPDTDYFVEVIDANTFHLATDINDLPGSRVDILDAGVGIHSFETIDKKTVFINSTSDNDSPGTRLSPVSSILAAKNLIWINNGKVNIHALENYVNKSFYHLMIYRKVISGAGTNGIIIEGSQHKLIWEDINLSDDFLQVQSDFGFVLPVSSDSVINFSDRSLNGDEFTAFQITGTPILIIPIPLQKHIIDTGHQGRWFTRFVPGAAPVDDRFELYWDRGTGYEFVISQPRFALEVSAEGDDITRYEYRILHNGDWVLCGMGKATSIGGPDTETFETLDNVIMKAGNQFFETPFNYDFVNGVSADGAPLEITYDQAGTAFVKLKVGQVQFSPDAAFIISLGNVFHDTAFFRNLASDFVLKTLNDIFFEYSAQVFVLPGNWFDVTISLSGPLVVSGGIDQAEERGPTFFLQNGTIGVNNFAGIQCANLIARNVSIEIDKQLSAPPHPAAQTRPFTPDGQYKNSDISYIGRDELSSTFVNRARTTNSLVGNELDCNFNLLFNFNSIRFSNMNRSLLVIVDLWEIRGTGLPGPEQDDRTILQSTFFSILTPDLVGLGEANGCIFHTVATGVSTNDFLISSVHFQSFLDNLGINNLEADPLFISLINPTDFRLRSVSGGFGIDSPALLYVPDVTNFTNAGAFDDLGATVERLETIVVDRPSGVPIQIKGESFQLNDLPDVVEAQEKAVSAIFNLNWTKERLRHDERLKILQIMLFSPLVRVYFNPSSRPVDFLEGVIMKQSPIELGNEQANVDNAPNPTSLKFKTRITQQKIEQLGGWLV